ncbi:MAG: hypothetical protein JNL85_18500, partial [Rubrivivax sp.]|nr:hypothetical protein [Rubrivivax sp.]
MTIIQRRRFLVGVYSITAAGMAACGSGGDAGDAPAQPTAAPGPSPAPGPTPAPTSAPTSAPTPAPTSAPTSAPTPAPTSPSGPSSSGLPLLTLRSGASGTLPYMSAVYPLQGAVPAGVSVLSPDEPNLSAAVLS